MSLKAFEEAEFRPDDSERIPAQHAKGIDVDGVEYEPGYGITEDWALSFYSELGGEGG